MAPLPDSLKSPLHRTAMSSSTSSASAKRVQPPWSPPSRDGEGGEETKLRLYNSLTRR